MKRGRVCAWAVVVSSLTVVLGCHRVVSGVDPEPLGYGPAPHQVSTSGYDADPVPRAAPTPWTPADRSGSPTALALGPTPYTQDVIRVCEHLASRAPSSSSSSDAACQRLYRVAQVFRTISDWKTLVACLSTTTDEAGVAACKRATPASVPAVAEHPRESAVCMHLFALGIVEELGPEPMLDPARLEEFVPLVISCVDSLVTEERAERGPSNYMVMLECVEVAQTTAAAELCAQ